MARIDPVVRGVELLDHARDVLGQTQLQQIGQLAGLGLAHDPFIAKARVATQQSRPMIARPR